MAPTGQIRMQRAHTVHFFLVECKKARFDVDGQRGGRAQSRAHAALHTLVLIMPDPLRHGRNQYALLPQVADIRFLDYRCGLWCRWPCFVLPVGIVVFHASC